MPSLQECIGQILPDSVEGSALLTTEVRVAEHSCKREFQVVRVRGSQRIFD
jgi:hypothetical protein